MKNLVTKTAITFSILGAIVFGIYFSVGSLIPAAQAHKKDVLAIDDNQQSRRNCSVHTIRGDYSYTAQGTILPGSPLPVPPGLFVSIGKVTLDGFGNITEHITNDNFNGLILPPTNFTGTYTVDGDCGGTAILVGRAPYKFTIADGGKEIFFMIDAPGTVVTGTAKRQ